MTLAVPALNIRRFEVDWNSEGISPSTIPEHQEYINNLCREVEYLMKEKIIHSINKRIREDVSDPLYEEVVQHLKFCQTKCEAFYGRKEILDRCKAYLQVNILRWHWRYITSNPFTVFNNNFVGTKVQINSTISILKIAYQVFTIYTF